MLFVLLSKRFLHMTVLDGFAFVAIHANLLDRYKYRSGFCRTSGWRGTHRIFLRTSSGSSGISYPVLYCP